MMITESKSDQVVTIATRGNWFNRNIIALGLVSFFTDISSEMLYPLTPIFLRETLGASPAILGIIEGIAEGTASVLKTFSGWLSDRIGKRKPLVIAGYSMASISKPLLAIAFHWWIVLVARFLDRFGKGVRTSARDALIADSCPPEERGKAYGFHRGMDTLGACIGPLAAIPLLAAFNGNFRPVFLLACIPAFIGAALTLLPKEVSHHSVSSPRPQVVSLSMKQFDPTFKVYVSIAIVFALANSTDTLLILRAKEIFKANHLSMTSAQATTLAVLCYALYNFVYAALSFPAGALSDRVGQRALLVGGFAVYALVYAGWAVAGFDWNVWVLFVVYGLFRALTQGVGTAYAANLAGAQNRGTALGIYHGYTGIAAVPASAIAGFIWWKMGVSAMFNFDAALSGIAAVLLLLLPQKH